MRDPQRIDRILAKLRGYWHAHPDLRLGQIVANLANQESQDKSVLGFASIKIRPYFLEDDDLEAQLDRILASFERDPLILS
jgi:uncharacterized protein YihD (DUF1040 family)